jgi:hypothetical protein
LIIVVGITEKLILMREEIYDQHFSITLFVFVTAISLVGTSQAALIFSYVIT